MRQVVDVGQLSPRRLRGDGSLGSVRALRLSTALTPRSAANTIMRSLTAAGFPLWVEVTLVKWGIGWACSLQGFVAVALMFVPLIFIRYGKTCVRSRPCRLTRQPARTIEVRAGFAAAEAKVGEVIDSPLDACQCTSTPVRTRARNT